jgi:Fe-S cluster assembly protein SufB
VSNFVTKRGICEKTQKTFDTSRNACNLKYPSVILKETIQYEFYSIAVTNNFQQADTGTK